MVDFLLQKIPSLCKSGGRIMSAHIPLTQLQWLSPHSRSFCLSVPTSLGLIIPSLDLEVLEADFRTTSSVWLLCHLSRCQSRFIFPPFSPSCHTELKKQDCWPSALFLHVPLLCISCHSRHPVVTSRAVFSSAVAICQVWLFKFKQLK